MSLLSDQDWEPGLEVILVTARPGTAPRYERAKVERTTPHWVVLASGARFRQDTGGEVAGDRAILPPWAPSYLILDHQISTTALETAVGHAALAFTASPNAVTAAAVRDAATAYLDRTDPTP